MKRIFLILAITTLIVSCEPTYHVIVRNQTNEEIFLRSVPAIESVYSSSSYYDSIKRLRVTSADSIATYRLPQNHEIEIWGYLGKPVVNDVPYEFLQVIVQGDTTLFSRQELIRELKLQQKGLYILQHK